MPSKFVTTIAMTLALGGPAAPAEFGAPGSSVVLTVTGSITNGGDGSAASFDMASLEALEGRTATMETPWTEGPTTFSGPFLRNVLATVGAKGRTIRLIALDDYWADIPVKDATELDTILATRMDGKLMSIRDKGPLFLIYPFDQSRDLYDEKYFSRSVWQIKEIKVVE